MSSQRLGGHEDIVTTVALDPEGRWLASGSFDNTVRLWNLNISQLTDLACAVAGRNFTLAEWERYFPQAKADYEVICPEWRPHPSAIQAQVQEGINLALQGQIEMATDHFAKALEMNPNVDLNPATQEIDQNPATEAIRLAAESLIREGGVLAQQGEIETALAKFTEATNLDPALQISMMDWNQLCWFGSLWGKAGQVEAACEQAVTLTVAIEAAPPRDSRGVNRALLGDFEGAIEDFEFYVANSGAEADDIGLRESWIEALERGENPFTEEVLAGLRGE